MLQGNWTAAEEQVRLVHARSPILHVIHTTCIDCVQNAMTLLYEAAWWCDACIPEGERVGANLVWELTVQINRGLATGNVSAVTQAFARAWQDVQVYPVSQDGVQVRVWRP